ncbi:MAG: GGDEF domain-containing protein [Atopobiaceae bacterium]|nr:GGDEF domain-containing protein [Atopobiaceae bacterium]
MKRYRIGLMVGNKSIDYIHSIRMGVQNTLEEAGHTLIAISDLIPFHSRINTLAYFRVAFEVAARLDLDAIIVPAGIIASYLANDQSSLNEFLGILDQSKVVVIEREIEGYRCITKNNVPGMRECMKHLIEDCGFKKIAFISGPETSHGAREREAVYFQEMQAHGLETPARLFARGEYSGECGGAIEELIDNNRDLEAIACCVDLIAFSVYDVMHKRHLSVGVDIAVTGFDDNAMSAHMDPPLSTVHITGYDLGCMAAREAIRICKDKPQKEYVLSSSFIARASCGERGDNIVEKYRSLITERPFPYEKVIDILCEHTLSMAGRSVTEEFRNAMGELLSQINAAFMHRAEEPESQEPLFSSQDLNLLFNRGYREYLSLEGFQTVAIALLKAIAAESPSKDSGWIIEQITNLHHGIARMLNAEVAETKLAMSRREWIAFHITDDAMRESVDPQSAYRLIMEEFYHLGVRQADVFLLPEPVEFIGTRTFALSDTLLPIGHLYNGRVKVTEGDSPISLQELLNTVLPRYGGSTVYTVGGIMAGDELMGIAALDAGTLDDDGQLIAFLNLGIALKHLQMIANERESNEILSKSNLLLERQSHYDEMTGILNRRGFMAKLSRVLNMHQGENGAMFYLDLDGLKFINDTYGHDNGDEAIRQTTRVLSACMPADTVLGRLGGDEFVAFALIEDESDIASIGHSVDVGMATFNATHSYPFDLAISYGGVLLPIDEHAYLSVTDTLAIADERLYHMKKKRGRARRR